MAARLTINGVSAGIVIDSGVRESQPESGAEATVVFQCTYSQRYDLVKGLLPRAYVSGTSIIRVKPYAYPPSPNLYCSAVSNIEGIGPYTDAAGWLQFKEARVTAEFKLPQWNFDASSDPALGGDPSGQPWTTTTCEVSAEILKVPGSGYVLMGSGEPLDEQVRGIMLPQVAIRMKRHLMPIVPLSQLITVGGCVNSATIKFANYTFPRGCLLCMGGTSEQAVDTTGAVVQEVEYILMGRPRGIEWNAFPGSDGTWRLANTISDGSGSYPYPYANLSSLP